jgi:tRNA threonylcarbamoyladenosine biosynthesis protein TsaB
MAVVFYGPARLPILYGIFTKLDMSYLLVLDTTFDACQAGLFQLYDGLPVALRSEPMTKGHAERLVPMVEAVLKQGSLSFPDISKIAVTRGPGSFTGLRVGLSAARAYGVALDIEVIGVTTLQAHAVAAKAQAEAFKTDIIWVLLDARRNGLYHQQFNAKGEALSEARLTDIEAITSFIPDIPFLLWGSGLSLMQNALKDRHFEVGESDAAPSLSAIAKTAMQNEMQDAATPFYLREADAKVSGKTPLKRMDA